VFKEVPQGGLTSKGNWDVNANATNYDFFDEKPLNYNTTTLTPSATGDGTFTLSSGVGYSLSSPSFGSSFNVGSQAGNPQEVVMKTDGTKMYVLDVTTKTIFEYDLSTNFDSSTATYNSVNSGSLGTTVAGDPYGFRFKPDGTKLYICEYGNILYQFSLGTAWDLSTISYDNQSITGFAGGYIPYCLAFKPDGTKVYTVGLRYLYEWVLPTAWSLSGATPTNIANGASANYLNISGYTTGHSFYGLDFSADGTKFFVRTVGGGSVGTGLFEVPIDSAWDPVNSTQEPISTDGSLAAGVTRYDALDTAHGSSNLTGFAFVNNGQQAVVCYSGAQDYVYTLNTLEALSFLSSDVGKKVVGNSGSAVITGTSGTYKSVTAFADTSAISSWQLFSAEGNANGSGITLSGFSNAYNLNIASYDNKNYATSLTSASGVAFSSDGTKMYLNGFNTGADESTNQHIWQYSLSTAWDVTTASYDNISLNTSAQNTRQRDLRFKPDGTVLYMVGSTPDGVWQYDLSTAWDLSTASYSNKTISVGSQDTNPAALALSPDGTKVYVAGYSSKIIFQYDLSTAWDLSSSTYWGWNYNRATSTDVYSTSAIDSMEINSSGTKLYVAVAAAPSDVIIEYDLPSNGKISDITYWDSYSQWTTLGGAGVDLKGIAFSSSGDKFYTFGTNDYKVYEFSVGSTSIPYSQYSPALTNSSNGQINSSSWVDIDSMVADETKNGGDVFYAVSTDNRSSWGVIKNGDGVRKIAKNNSGTWQYNNDAGTSTIAGYDLSSSASLSKTLSYSSQDASGTAMAFNNDGTKLYFTGEQNNIIHEYALSTAYDISTSSYNSVTFNPSVLLPIDIKWKPDGTKLYILDYDSSVRGTIYTFNVSTAWDITTASSASETFRGNAQDSSFIKFAFKTDGTMLFKLGRQGNRIHAYNLSTAWDVSTASYASAELPMGNVVSGSTTGTSMNGLAFNSSGTKVFVTVYHSSTASSNRIYEIDLSTAWDIGIDNNSNGNYAGVYLQIPSGINVLFNGDGSQVYTMNNSTDTILSYSSGSATIIYGTSETWVNGTNNNEHATLQEALGAQSFNRMDKAQLQAVTDPNHYVLGDTLDLMIAPYAASGTSPLSDGVTIGYQADALIKQAINGTDYEAEFPATNKVKIKSLAAQNLKIRII
jgi:DNA-binding beta-propeller fold protein YncE